MLKVLFAHYTPLQETYFGNNLMLLVKHCCSSSLSNTFTTFVQKYSTCV